VLNRILSFGWDEVNFARAVEPSKDVQVFQALSMVVVGDGANPGATARSGVFGAEM
jgi:hypothetical protein